MDEELALSKVSVEHVDELSLTPLVGGLKGQAMAILHRVYCLLVAAVDDDLFEGRVLLLVELNLVGHVGHIHAKLLPGLHNTGALVVVMVSQDRKCARVRRVPKVDAKDIGPAAVLVNRKPAYVVILPDLVSVDPELVVYGPLAQVVPSKEGCLLDPWIHGPEVGYLLPPVFPYMWVVKCPPPMP